MWGAKIYLERIGEWGIVDKREGAGQVCTYMTRGSAKEGDNVEKLHQHKTMYDHSQGVFGGINVDGGGGNEFDDER